MRAICHRFVVGCAILAAAGMAQDGPYKVLKTAKTGGLGGFDYIYADDAGRRLYIPRGAVQGETPTAARVTVFNLDTLAPAGEIPNIRANGAAVDAKSGHGFASSKPGWRKGGADRTQATHHIAAVHFAIHNLMRITYLKNSS